ncbi:ASCH domain-containing protein [Mycobacterium sp.]|uniref:ASCH domain-containing protein n=1 Tax=Mycobacterium sp. TaxID=1785 RepID=UPI00261A967B|nr:ASCH domain-containing protein [Mycobacterium sp.]
MQLGFTANYIEPILAGAKTTTLRARRPKFGPGDVFGARCRYGDPPFAMLRCVRVEGVTVAGLTAQDALLDGFDSAEALRATLRKLYPRQDVLWRIVFERVE